ncbi:hypothetical protein SORBI_3010G055900 [Sorghum bicolor]|uniref:Uncharacterized protein n=1 Tax=Sorghum bicolor TaxID=4558 RepID=A0A194YHH3_SORBI|nr:hypothetical protein SORBI_3010G055900 [Sorghum bicolor]
MGTLLKQNKNKVHRSHTWILEWKTSCMSRNITSHIRRPKIIIQMPPCEWVTYQPPTSSSEVIKDCSILQAPQHSEHWWLLRIPTLVVVYFVKRPFELLESTRSPNLSAPSLPTRKP